jgi:hypothetical protein
MRLNMAWGLSAALMSASLALVPTPSQAVEIMSAYSGGQSTGRYLSRYGGGGSGYSFRVYRRGNTSQSYNRGFSTNRSPSPRWRQAARPTPAPVLCGYLRAPASCYTTTKRYEPEIAERDRRPTTWRQPRNWQF